MTFAGRRAALAALPVLALLLAACATPTRPPPAAGWVAGKLSLRVEATDVQPERGLSALFELRGDADSGELQLTSPLGTLVAVARWAPGQAVLRTTEGEQRFGDLDALARGALGESLPLRALPAWLRGRPWDGAASRATTEGFEQLGWQVGLDRFAEGLITMTRPAPPAVTLRARLERDG
ncbi:MAG: lipoprotein insertase outer membrane protein LolB [Rubrivivax sp.]